ncbi:MAG: sensor domain-containing diguanylate cyclase [bacterium]
MSEKCNSVADEDDRVAALQELDILEGPREPALDQIAKLAQLEFEAQHAGIMMIDATRATFVARANIRLKSMPRDEAFCNIAIQRSEPLVIRDMLMDPRFRTHPQVARGLRSYVGIPLETRAGFNIGTLCVFGTEPLDFAQDKITKLQELAKLAMLCIELRRLAVQDHLTGCLNRRGFMAELDRHILHHDRAMADLSLAFMDLDHFKQVNDLFGHPAGDLVLQEVAALAAKSSPGSDLVGRLGGEEFGILMPGVTEASAVAAMDRLRLAIEHIALPEFPALRVTASFGIASLGPAKAEVAGLMAKVDAALYLAKANGRNRIVVAEGQPSRDQSMQPQTRRSGRAA